jgi:hypothetical protein
MTKPIALVIALAILAAACGESSGTPSTGPTTSVDGYVHAGPVCPVAQDPPDPNCADRPVAGAEMRVVDAAGDEVARVSTAEDGTFALGLPPGGYTLVPQPVEGLMGTAETQGFEVGSAAVHLDVAYDTGIR